MLALKSRSKRLSAAMCMPCICLRCEHGRNSQGYLETCTCRYLASFEMAEALRVFNEKKWLQSLYNCNW